MKVGYSLLPTTTEPLLNPFNRSLKTSQLRRGKDSYDKRARSDLH